MRISELAQRTGVSAHALRHYERLGLLNPPRTAGGYRDYAESARREVVFISMSRQIGFSLKDIAARLPAYRSGRLGFDEMAEAMEQRIAQIDAQVAALQAQRTQVADHIRWLREQQKQRQARRADPAGRKPWPGTSQKDRP
ncbi:MAG TPA: MerR family transcriptional regulator [Ramlibacter sp.]|nr:MerR family transcriptional regulator [Ramlibacter sp.]